MSSLGPVCYCGYLGLIDIDIGTVPRTNITWRSVYSSIMKPNAFEIITSANLDITQCIVMIACLLSVSTL